MARNSMLSPHCTGSVIKLKRIVACISVIRPLVLGVLQLSLLLRLWRLTRGLLVGDPLVALTFTLDGLSYLAL